MSEMIERMSEAYARSALKREAPELYAAGNGEGVMSADDPESLITLANLRQDMRAVLEEMRRPTGPMLNVDCEPQLGLIWRAMIDEALK